jgi:Fe-S-cluster containining protein
MSARDRALASLRALHREVDQRAWELAAHHGDRLQCRRGCSDCCVDGIRVFEVEAERIRESNADLVREGTPHPPGACAFLGAEGECRIYPDRPYVCRTQGLPLRWFDEAGEEVCEKRDICPLNVAGSPLEELEEEACWLLGPTEGRLAAIQEEFGGDRQRLALRSLFRSR